MIKDLEIAQQLFYEPRGLKLKDFKLESESQDYNACQFSLNEQKVKFRQAKITPTKIGQFVTLWKRVNGPIVPFDLSDDFDLVIITVRKEKLFGQFILPKDVLLQQGYISKNNLGGKRAMRVYPPWDIVESKQAKATQAWQLKYFYFIEQ